MDHPFPLQAELCELRAVEPGPVLVLLAEPGVEEGVPGRDALVWVLHQQLLHQVLRRHRDVLPLTVTELVLTLHVLIQNLVWAVAFEKRPARQNDVKDDSNAEYVRLAVVALLLEELGGDVARTAAAQVELLGVVFDHGGQAEVGNFQIPVVLLRGEEQVLRLQVPMHDVLGMQVLKRADEVLHHRPGVGLSIQALTLDLVEELTTLEVRQEQVDVLGRLVGLVQLDHVFMVNFTQHIDLSQNRLLQQKG